MIRENQKTLHHLHVLSDGAVLFLAFPAAFWIRFHLFHGDLGMPLRNYILMGAVYTAAQLFTYAAFSLYQSFRAKRLRVELVRLWEATLLDAVILQSLLFMSWGVHYSRGLLLIAFALSVGVLSVKRIILRKALRRYRMAGHNLKHVLILGSGTLAQKYLREIEGDRALGYDAIGYVSDSEGLEELRWLGGFEKLEDLLEKTRPDEVVAALEPEDVPRTPRIITACDSAGVRLSFIPFFAGYVPSTPQLDDLNGIPLMNIRHIPLDNWTNAFLKRAMDIVVSALALLLLSPVMALCAIGVKLSSPGPVIFRQERVGRGQERFWMYKFRSMRVNSQENTAWSTREDDRRTRFGAFMRKCSLDELPQLWNVLKGDMSLVGPRPELPYFVEQFRDEVPLYMVKHQVRPGITGWAQVHDLRGDTSIQARVDHDIYYIEHWSFWFDVQILLTTLFGGKFINKEELSREKVEQ